MEHNDEGMEANLERYNAYLQALDDIRSGELDLPGIEDQKTFVKDLERYIRREFVSHAVTMDRDNDYHKALYAFCVERYLRNLKNGIFDGNGVSGTRPEIAETIEDHVTQLLTDSLIGV